MPPSAWGYSRLSRDDKDAVLPLAERFAVRAQILRDLAARYGLDLPDERILHEQVSGERLDNRPLMLKLLALCQRAQVTHLVTTEQARVLRGDKRDEARIEDAFVEAGIVLISTEGMVDFGAEDYDPLPYEVRALVARHELRLFRRRRRAANAARYAQNKRSAGRPPWGYRKEEDAPGGYALVPEAYALMAEAFARARHETVRAICRDWERRGIPNPSGGPHWYVTTLRRLLSNPFYAGFHARNVSYDGRTKRARRLAAQERRPDAATEGDWTHPIMLEAWQEVQEIVSGRWKTGQPRDALLTGVLRCAGGYAMSRAGNRYHCNCREERKDTGHHESLWREAAERYARAVVTAVLEQLPTGALGMPADTGEDRRQLQTAAAQARRDLAARQAELDALIRQSAQLAARFNAEDFERVVRQVTAEREAARESLARLEAKLDEPDPRELLPLLTAVREKGLGMFWQEPEAGGAPNEEKRAVLRGLIARMDLCPTDAFYTQAIRVTLHPWLKRYKLRLPRYKPWSRG